MFGILIDLSDHQELKLVRSRIPSPEFHLELFNSCWLRCNPCFSKCLLECFLAWANIDHTDVTVYYDGWAIFYAMLSQLFICTTVNFYFYLVPVSIDLPSIPRSDLLKALLDPYHYLFSLYNHIVSLQRFGCWPLLDFACQKIEFRSVARALRYSVVKTSRGNAASHVSAFVI